MRVVVAALASAIALFFFGFLWWGVSMPALQLAGVIEDQTVVDSMSSAFKESGIYFYPDPSKEPGEATGPMAILYYTAKVPEMGATMGMGFGHMLLTALGVTLFVHSMKFQTFSERFRFVCCLGVFLALWADIGNMIWWHHPTTWAIYHFGYDVLSWVVAGAIIAAILKPVSREADGSPAAA